jgi:hypothetical protein
MATLDELKMAQKNLELVNDQLAEISSILAEQIAELTKDPDYLWWEHVDSKGIAFTLYTTKHGFFNGVLRNDATGKNVARESRFYIEDLQSWAVEKSVELGGHLCKVTDDAIPFFVEAKHESYCSTCGKPCEYIVKFDSEAHIVGDETQPGIYAVSACCGSDVKADPELETEFTYFDETDVTERVG